MRQQSRRAHGWPVRLIGYSLHVIHRGTAREAADEVAERVAKLYGLPEVPRLQGGPRR